MGQRIDLPVLTGVTDYRQVTPTDIAQFIRLAHLCSGTHTRARHEHREGVDMVVAPELAVALLPNLSHGSAAEFPTPDHQRLVQQSPPLQVFQQAGDGPIAPMQRRM